MIPDSHLKDEIFEMRQRVTACRNRVRSNRTRHRPKAVQFEETRVDRVSAVSRASGYTEDCRIVEGVLQEHEVGIT